MIAFRRTSHAIQRQLESMLHIRVHSELFIYFKSMIM